MHSNHRPPHLQLLREVYRRRNDPRALLRLRGRLLLVQRFHGVREGVFLVLLARGVEHLQGGFFELQGALFDLEHVLVLGGADALLDFLLELHYLLFALAEVALQGSVHGHYLFVDLLQLAVLGLLFPQLFVVELVLDGLGLYFCQFQGQIFQQSLLQLQSFVLLEQQMVDPFVFPRHFLLPSLQLSHPHQQAPDLFLQVRLALRPLVHRRAGRQFLASFAGLLGDLLDCPLLREVVDVVDVDGEALLGGAGRQVEVVIVELLELDVAGLGVAARR